MASEFETVPLGNVATVRSGFAFKSSDWSEDGIPVVKIANVKEGRLIMDGCSFVPNDVANSASDFALQTGDILIAMTGYIGDVALVRDNDLPGVVNQRVGRFSIVNKKRLERNFLFYLLRSVDIRNTIEGLGYGSAQPNVSPTMIHGVEIPLPPIDEQRAIDHILGTLDDKIDLNRRMCATLEEMARALFKSWFVDFDPVRAKAEGRDTGLPKHLADLFPDRLVDSELGEIPDGWEVKLAADTFDVSIGKTPPRKEQHWFTTNPNDIPWMSIKDLGQASVYIKGVSEYLTKEAANKFRIKKIPDGTVVLSFKLTVGRVAITDGNMLSNEAIAHFSPLSSTFLSPEFMYCYLKQFDYNKLGSTSSIATATNSDGVRSIPIIIPPRIIHDGFACHVKSTFRRLRSLQMEISTLVSLRDTFLPKLISGELRVPNVEKFMGSGL